MRLKIINSGYAAVDTRVFLDDKEISDYLTAISLRFAVGEPVEVDMSLILDGQEIDTGADATTLADVYRKVAG